MVFPPLREELQGLEPYGAPQVSLERAPVQLNTNENPYGPSPRAIAAMQAEVNDSLRLYPDPNGERLKRAVAEYYDVKPEQVFVGNGSDEVLAHAFHGLFQHGKPLLFPDVTYSFYPVYCGLYGIEFEAIALDERFQLNVDDYARPNGGIIFPNPNAPTGCLLGLDAIERLLQANPDSVVLVDEAYIDFGGVSAIALVDRYPNLLVSQTLSKSRSLAGLRVGLAVGHPDLIEALERIKNSFNSYPLDKLAIVAGAAAFEDQAWFRDTCQKVIDSREQVRDGLIQRGFNVLPSAANFIFARHTTRSGADLAAALRKHGVIVRHFSKPERISDFLRITIGTPEQNQALFEALDAEL